MSKESNFLISASAGTGKTFALASHVIRLLLAGEPPHTVAALTFSRLAAAEIFDRVVQRLAAAAASAPAAAREAKSLRDGCPAGLLEAIAARYPAGLDAGVFLAALRAFLAEQHRSMLGTIDSFLGRIVKFFPTEVGLQGPMEMLDTDDLDLLREQVVASVFTSDRPEDFEQLQSIFRYADGEKSSKSFFTKAVKNLDTWRDSLLDHPSPTAWGDPDTLFGDAANAGLLGLLRLDEESARGQIREKAELFRENVGAMCEGEKFAKCREYLGAFCDVLSREPERIFSSGAATPVKNFLAAASSGEGIVTCGGKKLNLGTQTSALRDIVLRAQAVALSGALRRMRGLYVLLLKLEAAYEREGSSQGKLGFSDIPRLIAGLGRRDSGHLRDLEYRFDTQFRHLALDEFQDTSPSQWDALRPTVEELKQSDDDRSLFVVGDVKQAIYGWRGGDSRLFSAERASGEYTLFDLSESYRFRPEISEFVNRVFDGAALEGSFSGSSKAADACGLWRSFWVCHSSHEKDRKGYVRVERGPAPDDPDAKAEADALGTDDIRFHVLLPVVRRLRETRPWHRGLTSAVLVRSNDDGSFAADVLRFCDIPAVWEGESSIDDTPVVGALLDLLVLAEHPDGKTLEWGHVAATPLVETLFPGERLDTPAKLSRRVAEDVSRKGLASALRDWSGLILASLPAVGASSELRARFESLVAAAIDFSANANRRGTLFDFKRFVESRTQRNFADSSTVKVLTQHRSKGLGFDQVFVPVFPKKGANGGFSEPKLGSFQPPEFLRDPAVPPAWVFPYVSEGLRKGVGPLENAFKAGNDAKTFEDLCRLYVSATRAKAELFFALPPPRSKPSKESDGDRSFPEYLEAALSGLPFELGEAGWYEQTELGEPDEKTVPETARGTASAPASVPSIRRRTPSKAHPFGQSAANLFASAPRASERGTSLHDRLAGIDWIDPGAGQPADIAVNELDLSGDSPFRRALERPADAAGLWRERSFEILWNNEWISGTFDRVVFRGGGDGRRVELYDYKSNRLRAGETAEDFESRMKETYSGQMETYRQALHRLSGVPLARISAALLLTATRARVDL